MDKDIKELAELLHENGNSKIVSFILSLTKNLLGVKGGAC